MELACEKVKGSMPAIVERMVEEALEGSHPHAKTLLEMSGVRQRCDSTATHAAGEPWAKLVLERLDEVETKDNETPAEGAATTVQTLASEDLA